MVVCTLKRIRDFWALVRSFYGSLPNLLKPAVEFLWLSGRPLMERYRNSQAVWRDGPRLSVDKSIGGASAGKAFVFHALLSSTGYG